jgi:hypothetical protein
MDVDLEALETRVQVLEAVMLALVRTSSAPEVLLAEFDRAVQRLDAFLAFQERPLAQERLARHVERVRVQLEPD